MHPKVKLFRWCFVRTLITWATFFIVNAVSDDHILAAVVAFLAFVALAVLAELAFVIDYIAKTKLTEKYVLLSLAVEFIAIATPMLYFVLK